MKKYEEMFQEVTDRIIDSLESASDFLHLEAFDDVAHLDVLVVLERHAAFKALRDFTHFILEELTEWFNKFKIHIGR